MPDSVAAAPRPPTSTHDRTGAAALWAVLGLLWLAFAGQAIVRWAMSDRLHAPAPVLGPDVLGDGKLVALRTIEALSVVLLSWCYWHFLVQPWHRDRRLSLDGSIVIGATLAAVIDPMINYFQYTFAWNAHAFNAGSWLAFFPLHTGPERYGEGLVWFVPQYVYLGIGFAAIECALVRWLRRRRPSISNVAALALTSGLMFAVDVLFENAFVRLEVYAFPRTIEAFTLFPGSRYQFPLYESLFVACYALGFAVLRLSAEDDVAGRSFVERGLHRVRPRARAGVRVLAVAGYCAVLALASYFGPWSWLSVNADSIVKLPSYLMPG